MDEQLYHVETGGGYEWSDWAVYHHPNRPTSFFTWTESGCSCDGWEGPSDEDAHNATPMTKSEVRNHFVEWWDDSSTNFDGSDAQGKVHHLEKLVQVLLGKWLRTEND